MSTDGGTEGCAAHSNTPSAFLPRGKNPTQLGPKKKQYCEKINNDIMKSIKETDCENIKQ